jgi:hypothetical protein
MLIDEAARVSDEIYKAVRPMLAVGNGDLLMMSTPNGADPYLRSVSYPEIGTRPC